jgi:GNAT superfamily N-acetyltransferase
MEPRHLRPPHAALLDAFLLRHRASSMFLRSNARRGGLVDRGKYLQATYVGCFRDGALIGVAAHCWNGMLLVQAPEAGLSETVCAAVKHSRRGVNGFSGPLDQIQRARHALGLDRVPTQLEEQESLFALQLSELIVPAALSDGTLQCRPPLPEERQLLGDWRLGFDVESLNVKASESARKRAGESVDSQIAGGNAWVVIAGGAPVSYSAFNAALPDIVQLGGIYTPPEQRGRGYARAGVAGSLLAARARGVTRAVLFTKNPSAMRAYEAVGFRRIGEYGLVLLARPVPSGPAGP